MPLRSLSFLIALLCFTGLRVGSVVPAMDGAANLAKAPQERQAALLFACETVPDRLTLPQTVVPLGLTDSSGALLATLRGTFSPLYWVAAEGEGRRVWRAVSRGPPEQV